MLINDLINNNISLKSQIIVVSYRISNYFATHSYYILRIVGIPIRIIYKVLIEMIMSVELPDKLKAGKDLRVFHGMGLVVNANSIIGSGVSLRHNTTIGSKTDDGPCPFIEDNVSIGANVVIIGGIVIGHDSIIGAGAVVTKSFPPYSVIAGNPAKIIKRINV